MSTVKIISILALTLLGACQASTSSLAPITVINAPASDHAETLDLTKLPEGFPVIGELELTSKPVGCGLSKANRFTAKDEAPGQNYDSRYVFTLQNNDGSEPIYQLGINGVLRAVKQSGSADTDLKKVRYYKTIDGPEVEVMVAIAPGEAAASSKGIMGRIKAWDAGLPLMCAYNRIEVVGDCDL